MTMGDMTNFPHDRSARLVAARTLLDHVLSGEVPINEVADAIVNLVTKAAEQSR